MLWYYCRPRAHGAKSRCPLLYWTVKNVWLEHLLDAIQAKLPHTGPPERHKSYTGYANAQAAALVQRYFWLWNPRQTSTEKEKFLSRLSSIEKAHWQKTTNSCWVECVLTVICNFDSARGGVFVNEGSVKHMISALLLFVVEYHYDWPTPCLKICSAFSNFTSSVSDDWKSGWHILHHFSTLVPLHPLAADVGEHHSSLKGRSEKPKRPSSG